jgi:type IV secretory pathway VirB2 component (pilin)
MNKAPNKLSYFIFFALLLLLFPSLSAFAADALGMMEGTANKFLDMFKSPLVTAILAICVSAAGVAFAAFKDNEKVKRNMIAIIIGGIMIICAQQIVEIFMK